MRHMIPLVVLTMLVGVGCASTGGEGSGPVFGRTAWERALEAHGVSPADSVYPFELSPEMERWIEEHDRRFEAMEPVPRLYWLQQALFNPRDFPFAYDERKTLTAAAAFESREGNCLAFTSMFIGLSRAMGLDTFLVRVSRQPEVDREDSLVVLNGHVVAGFRQAGRLHLFDFYVTSDVPYQLHTMVDDVVATALYHTNLGANSLRSGEPEEAIRHLELATRLAPGFTGAWINLGVARSRADDVEGAFAAYDRALEVDPSSPSALTNMAYLYWELDMPQEARSALIAASQGRSSPFTLIALADVEMVRGDLETAESHLHRAKRIDRHRPEVFEAMARLAKRRGDVERAEKMVRRANRLREKREGE